MNIFKIKDMVRGWIIGDFEPSVVRTKDFEVGIVEHFKGQKWPKHYHKVAKEINCLILGRMMVHNTIIEEGDIFVFDPGETCEPIFLEDCKILVVKTPSVIGDKYEI